MLNTPLTVLLLVISLTLTSCLNNARFASLEPPEQSGTSALRQSPAQAAEVIDSPTAYRVQAGDTLYSIAFRFALNYQDVAIWNDIDASYRIYPGQALTLSPPEDSSSTASAVDRTATSLRSDKAEGVIVSQEIDGSDGVKKITNNQSLSWYWPHDGKIVRTFDADKSDQKGIDMEGEIGESILASADGTVVYAGNGLPGYGNLIILDHSGSYLSAYAFNKTLLVAEKDQVEAGTAIATMGLKAGQPRLHFEIRRGGKPVNPLVYLPDR